MRLALACLLLPAVVLQTRAIGALGILLQHGGGHIISGIVREEGTNSPINAVALQLLSSGNQASPSVTSGMQGEFSFRGIPDAKPDKQMVGIALKIVEQQEGDFEPGKFVDRYEEALRALIKEKQKGHKPVRAPEPADTNVIDLMSALKKSLRAKPEASRAPAAKKPPRRAKG